MRLHFYLLLLFCCFACSGPATAQSRTADSSGAGNDLMALLGSDSTGRSAHHREHVTATFKATRIINGHSVENDGAGVLDFRILHRFGALNQGGRNFFGLDNAVTKLAFDYGVTDWLMIGVGRSTFEKEYDGFIKAKLYRQTVDGRHPFTLSVVTGMSIQDMEKPDLPAGQEYYFSNRLFYANQLLIARKFNERLSLQLMPTIVHYNLVNTSDEPNNTVAIGLGGRVKVSRRIALTGEYYYRLPSARLNNYHNALSLGIDIETGGHVFQLFFTNSTGISERTFIGQTTNEWNDGGIHFGFNISRVFTVVRPREFRGSGNKNW